MPELPDEGSGCSPTSIFPVKSAEGAVRPKRVDILVLEGAGSNPGPVAAILEETGYSVLVRAPDATTLAQALETLPGLVVACVRDDDGEVLRFVHELRLGLRGYAPPTILVTEAAEEEALRRAFNEGVCDVLSVPLVASLFRVKVARYLRPSAARRAWIGDFLLKGVLGRGGMGTVYHAERNGCDLALKVIDADAVGGDFESIARFRRETELLRSLRGAGIPRFYEAGRIDDTFYCAMEYVRGQSLDRLLVAGRFSDVRTERLLVDLSRALGIVHGAGLVHRDVKPSNVIIRPDGSAMLVDFGLAKEIADHALTRPDEIIGTVSYFAPELACGGNATPATDAFALGMTAFEAALGQCPMKGSSFTVLRDLARNAVPRPSRLLEGACESLTRVLDGLLEPEPGARIELGAVEGRLGSCCDPMTTSRLDHAAREPSSPGAEAHPAALEMDR
ncbi:protein kinase [bacterium]|nr:protein kinase [bacterium]